MPRHRPGTHTFSVPSVPGWYLSVVPSTRPSGPGHVNRVCPGLEPGSPWFAGRTAICANRRTSPSSLCLSPTRCTTRRPREPADQDQSFTTSKGSSLSRCQPPSSTGPVSRFDIWWEGAPDVSTESNGTPPPCLSGDSNPYPRINLRRAANYSIEACQASSSTVPDGPSYHNPLTKGLSLAQMSPLQDDPLHLTGSGLAADQRPELAGTPSPGGCL